MLQLLNSLFNKVFGSSAWLPSFLFLLISILPLGMSGIIKLGGQLDVLSYTFCIVVVPCICILLLGFYSPLESLHSSSTQLSDKYHVRRIISKVCSKLGGETWPGGKKQRKYVSALLSSCRPLQCKLYCFGFIDKGAKATLFNLIVDSTVYLLLTF
jgi:hypothetical protein